MQTDIVSIVARASAVAAIVFGSLAGCGAQQQTAGGGTAASPDSQAKPTETGTLAASTQAPSSGRPIMDTHIHLYQVTKAGGVPWPPPKAKNLYRDILPAEYKELG